MKQHLFRSALLASGVLLFGAAADAQVVRAPRSTLPDSVPTAQAPRPGTTTPPETTTDTTTPVQDPTLESSTTLSTPLPRDRTRAPTRSRPLATATTAGECDKDVNSGAMGCPG